MSGFFNRLAFARNFLVVPKCRASLHEIGVDKNLPRA